MRSGHDLSSGAGNFAAVMVGGKVFRGINPRSLDAKRRLDDMVVDDVSVLSGRFSRLLTMPMRFVVRSTKALPRLCAGHPGVSRGSPWCRSKIRISLRGGQSSACAASRSVHPSTAYPWVTPDWMKSTRLLQQVGLMLMIHPLHPLGLDRMGGRPELAAVAAFPLETSFAATSLMTHGVLERFPKLRVLLSHGGGAASSDSAAVATCARFVGRSLSSRAIPPRSSKPSTTTRSCMTGGII